MKRLKKILISCVIVIHAAALWCRADAQTLESSRAYAYWLDFSAGAGTMGGLALGGSLDYQRNGILFSAIADGQVADEWFSSKSRSIWEVGLMAGSAKIIRQDRSYYHSISGGVSIVTYDRCVDNCGLFDGPSIWKSKSGIGFPIRATLGWRSFKYVGIGFIGSANINSLESFASINFSIQAGKFR